jgi:autotransporter-associated beta strand protein
MIYCSPSASCRRSILAGTVATIISAGICLDPKEAQAGNTWDGGSSLNGNWSTVQNWDADTLPDFSTPITFGGNANLLSTNDLLAISVGGIIFDPLADAFTLRGSAITLTGNIANNALTNQTINLAMTVDADRTIDVSGSSLTIGPGGTSTGVISGAGGITKTGLGTLTLGAVNTYTGATTLDGGSVVYTADNTVSALNFGFVPTASTVSTNTSTLDLTNANLTASSMSVQSNTSAPNTITIGAGKTLTVNGAATVGVSEVYTNIVAGVRTALTVTGAGGSWVVNGGAGNFSVGVPRSNTGPGGDPASTVDLTGLSNFTYNATGGEFRVGGGNVAGTLLLANTSNMIVAAQVRVGDSSIQPPGGAGNNNGGPGNLMLGLGTNVINTNTIIIGATKSQGIVGFQDAAQGSITIAGQAGGTSTVNITIGNASSGTSTGNLSQLNLAGHTANIEAGTVIIGRLGGSTGGTGNGSITFDTGTFNAVSMQFAVNATGTAPNGAVGIFTFGGPVPNNTSTAVLNVTSQFLLSNRTNAANQTSPANGTFVINGGTANINADIIDASTQGTPAARNTTLTLAAGKLDMMGHAIGSSTAPITTVNMPGVGSTAILSNLGGTGINGAGPTMNGGGILILDGTNTYPGATTVANGSIKLATASAYSSGSALALGDALGNSGVFDLSGFNVNVSGLSTVGSGIANLIGNSSTTSSSLITINNTGSTEFTGTIQDTLDAGNRTVALTMTGGGLKLSGNNTYTGPTNVSQGTLTVTGAITSALNLNNGGSLVGSGNGTTTGKVGNVTMAPGSSIRPGPIGGLGDTGTLTLAGLVVNGGDIQLDLGVSGDLINVLGTANFTAASTLTPSPAAAPGTYTVLTAGTLTLGTPPTIVVPPNTRTSFTPDFSTANAIKIVVAGINKSLTWTGQAGATWVVGSGGPLNWNDGAVDERFFNADSVTFANGPVNRNITISGIVVPSSVTVNNGAGNDYSFSGGAIDGGASIVKSGAGKLTLGSANTHVGGVTLNAGTLNLNHPNALGAGTLTIAGGSLDNTSGAPLTVATNNLENWNANFSFTGTNNLDLGIGPVTLNVSPVVTVDANTLTLSGVISGAFELTKAGPGALSLVAANFLTGGVRLTSGTLNINNPNALGAGAFTIEGGTIDNTSGATITVAGNVPLSLNGDFAFAGTNPFNLGTGPVTLSADRTVNVANNTLTIGGVIDGTFGLTKTGNGTLILSGSSTHTGAVNINAGRLTVTNATAGGSSLGALAGGAVTVASGATLDLSGNLAAQALNFGAKQFTIAGTGMDGTGAIVNNGVSQFNALQHVILSADATVGGSARFDIRAVPTTSLSASLDLQGHTFTKIGANQFSLVGVDVTDGDIVVNQGVFSIETVTNIPDFGTNKTITFNTGTTLQVFSNTAAVSTVNRPMVFNGGNSIGTGSNNNNSTIGSNMTLNGDVTFTNFGGATATSTLTLTGNLSETAGPRSITKIGASRLVLAGNNSYTGTTTVTAGGLIVSGTLNGTSSVSVQNAALLGGSGTITTGANGSVSLAAGTSLAPGDGAGTLTLVLGTGSLDLSATAGLTGYLRFELGPTADRVLLSSGNLNIGTGGLDLDDFTFTDVGGLAEGTYVLFDTNSDIVGTLGSHLQDNLLGFGVALQFANGANGRDDLVLVVLPEPNSVMALLVGLGVLATRRRKSNV